MPYGSVKVDSIVTSTQTVTVDNLTGVAAANAFTGANTFTNSTGQVFRRAATQDGVLLRGRAGGTSSYTVELIPATLSASRTATLPDANVTVAGLELAQTFTAPQRGSISALTSASTVTIDLSTAQNFSITLGHNVTFANPTNLTAGQSGVITVTQSSGTLYNISGWGTNWKFMGGTLATATQTASAVDVIAYYCESATRITAAVLPNTKNP